VVDHTRGRLAAGPARGGDRKSGGRSLKSDADIPTIQAQR